MENLNEYHDLIKKSATELFNSGSLEARDFESFRISLRRKLLLKFHPDVCLVNLDSNDPKYKLLATISDEVAKILTGDQHDGMSFFDKYIAPELFDGFFNVKNENNEKPLSTEKQFIKSVSEGFFKKIQNNDYSKMLETILSQFQDQGYYKIFDSVSVKDNKLTIRITPNVFNFTFTKEIIDDFKNILGLKFSALKTYGSARMFEANLPISYIELVTKFLKSPIQLNDGSTSNYLALSIDSSSLTSSKTTLPSEFLGYTNSIIEGLLNYSKKIENRIDNYLKFREDVLADGCVKEVKLNEKDSTYDNPSFKVRFADYVVDRLLHLYHNFPTEEVLNAVNASFKKTGLIKNNSDYYRSQPDIYSDVRDAYSCIEVPEIFADLLLKKQFFDDKDCVEKLKDAVKAYFSAIEEPLSEKYFNEVYKPKMVRLCDEGDEDLKKYSGKIFKNENFGDNPYRPIEDPEYYYNFDLKDHFVKNTIAVAMCIIETKYNEKKDTIDLKVEGQMPVMIFNAIMSGLASENSLKQLKEGKNDKAIPTERKIIELKEMNNFEIIPVSTLPAMNSQNIISIPRVVIENIYNNLQPTEKYNGLDVYRNKVNYFRDKVQSIAMSHFNSNSQSLIKR